MAQAVPGTPEALECAALMTRWYPLLCPCLLRLRRSLHPVSFCHPSPPVTHVGGSGCCPHTQGNLEGTVLTWTPRVALLLPRSRPRGSSALLRIPFWGTPPPKAFPPSRLERTSAWPMAGEFTDAAFPVPISAFAPLCPARKARPLCPRLKGGLCQEAKAQTPGFCFPKGPALGQDNARQEEEGEAVGTGVPLRAERGGERRRREREILADETG